MLAIRLKRTGRSGHAQFRVIVQDSRFHPSRGKVVAYLGSYDPHAKTATIDKDAAQKYLNNGAQPSDRVARLLKVEGVKLPDWVSLDVPKKRTTRNPEKRRSTRPAEETKEPQEQAVEPTEEAPTEESPAETPAETPAEPAAEEPAPEPPSGEPSEPSAEGTSADQT